MASNLKQAQTLDMFKTLEMEVKKRSTMLAAYHASAMSIVEKALILWYAPGYDRGAYSGIIELIDDLVQERFGEVSSGIRGVELSISQTVLSVRTSVQMSSWIPVSRYPRELNCSKTSGRSQKRGWTIYSSYRPASTEDQRPLESADPGGDGEPLPTPRSKPGSPLVPPQAGAGRQVAYAAPRIKRNSLVSELEGQLCRRQGSAADDLGTSPSGRTSAGCCVGAWVCGVAPRSHALSLAGCVGQTFKL